jgi:hypothetical protein
VARAPAGPGPLGLPAFDGLPESEVQAWWAELRRWVAAIRVAYPHLWPDRPGDDDPPRRALRKPFPRCWKQHLGTVSDLCVLRTWHDGLRDGTEWAGGAQGWHEFRVFLDRVADDLQTISRLCAAGHPTAMLTVAQAARR